MMERRSRPAGRALTAIAISALAIASAALVTIALQTEPVPNAGVTPAVPGELDRPSPGSPQGSAPSPSESDLQIGPATRLIDALDDNVAVRAITGECGPGGASVERTIDGGRSWTTSVLPAEALVQEVLVIDVVSADQVDLVVRAGADCAVNLLTSYTGGEYWQSYPDRIVEKDYLDPIGTQVQMSGGTVVPIPCPSAVRFAASPNGVAISCTDGMVVYSDALAQWNLITLSQLTALVWLPSTTAGAGSIIGVHGAQAGCSGLTITEFPADGSLPAGVAKGCIEQWPSDAETALTAGTASLWLWIGDEILKSNDGGTVWAAA